MLKKKLIGSWHLGIVSASSKIKEAALGHRRSQCRCLPRCYRDQNLIWVRAVYSVQQLLMHLLAFLLALPSIPSSISRDAAIAVSFR